MEKRGQVTIFIIIAIIIVGAWVYIKNFEFVNEGRANLMTIFEKIKTFEFEEKELPSGGVILPIVWGDFGLKLVNAGVINEDRFKAIYEERGVFTEEYRDLLLEKDNG